MQAPELFKHQLHTSTFVRDVRRSLVFNDPGTGKTASILHAYRQERKVEKTAGRMLVFAPKAILRSAWCADCVTFTPDVTIAAAFATNRRQAFETGADIVVTNHDAATWIEKNMDVLEGFDWLAIDESTAFKNRTAKRSKALAKIAKQFDVRIAMTGTPMANHILDIWHQVYLVDGGEHLGGRYFAFRNVVCEPVQVTMDITDWKEKPGSRDVVADLIAPITIRYRFEDCVDIPQQYTTDRHVQLSPKLRKHYDDMVQQALLQLEEGDVEAVNAAALVNKLMQIASGAVYGATGPYLLDTERCDLVAELCAEREHTLVAFQWKHQREGLIQALERAGIDSFGIIDGSTKDAHEIVQNFQRGEYQVLLAQPQSAGHGLTLTKAKTIIWAAPTWNAEIYEQFNRRIYRTGQDQKTEVIHLLGTDTVDERVYNGLRGKLEGQLNLLEVLQDLTKMQEPS